MDDLLRQTLREITVRYQVGSAQALLYENQMILAALRDIPKLIKIICDQEDRNAEAKRPKLRAVPKGKRASH